MAITSRLRNRLIARSEINHRVRNFIQRRIELVVSREERKIDPIKGDTRTIRENVERFTAEANLGHDSAEVQQSAYLQKLSDQDLEQETQRLKKARYFAGFPTKEAALAFAASVENAELAAGSSAVRSRTLAWCAQLLSLWRWRSSPLIGFDCFKVGESCSLHLRALILSQQFGR